jgi:hypothetical protein
LRSLGRRAGSRRSLAFAILLVLVTSGLGFSALQWSSTASSSVNSSSLKVRSPPLAPVYHYLPYDEQVGVTFAQNFTSLSVNVTAVEQKDPTTGIGPAYLLNGLTNSDYWYQVGLSYDWPMPDGTPLPGFNMSYEVFEPQSLCNPFIGCNCEGSIFPMNCGIGTANLIVNPGDIVQLSLSFSTGNVTMRAEDWNTTSSASASFTAEGGTLFMGLPNLVATNNGFFTGLMTEQYYATPYYGAGQPVIYRQTGENVSAAMMWTDEFDTYTSQPVFSNQTPSSVSFANTTLLQYFSSHGTGEAADANELVTGLTPIVLPSLTTSISSIYRPGQQASIVVVVDNPSGLTIRVSSLQVSSEFGIYDITSYAPSNFAGNSTFNAGISIPSSLSNGTYTLTIVASIQFLDPQIPDWFGAQPIYSSSALTVSGPPYVPPSNPTTLLGLLLTIGHIFLPTILACIAAGVIAAITVVLVVRQKPAITIDPFSSQGSCKACGGVVERNMMFCPNCGTPLTPPVNPAGAEFKTEESGQSTG